MSYSLVSPDSEVSWKRQERVPQRACYLDGWVIDRPRWESGGPSLAGCVEARPG